VFHSEITQTFLPYAFKTVHPFRVGYPVRIRFVQKTAFSFYGNTKQGCLSMVSGDFIKILLLALLRTQEICPGTVIPDKPDRFSVHQP